MVRKCSVGVCIPSWHYCNKAIGDYNFNKMIFHRGGPLQLVENNDNFRRDSRIQNILNEKLWGSAYNWLVCSFFYQT